MSVFTRLGDLSWYVVDGSGIRPNPRKIEAGDICRFLGMVNQMGKFTPKLSEISQPLRALLVKGNQWVWDKAQQKAFNQIKEITHNQSCLSNV